MLRPILPAWVPFIARLWPNSKPRKNAGDGRVTFIAGPPHELMRIWSHQEIGEPTPTADRPMADQKCYYIKDATDCSDLVL
jgi:hypothetical protein